MPYFLKFEGPPHSVEEWLPGVTKPFFRLIYNKNSKKNTTKVIKFRAHLDSNCVRLHGRSVYHSLDHRAAR